MYTRTSTYGPFYSKESAVASVPDGVDDVEVKMVDRFNLEEARANWPDANPPGLARMRAAAKDGIVEIWHITYTASHRDQRPER